MRTCPICQAKIVGRTDKKFCSDDCRANYHNRKNRNKNRPIKRIERILKRNRQILIEVEKQGVFYISLTLLEKMGFDFEYCTRKRSYGDQTEISCYDKSYNIVQEAGGTYVRIQGSAAGKVISGSNFHSGN